ncbi:DEAD/DEAH box helicase [Pontibacter actiniarum]|uniref:DNA helicase n=1 Tax=Pontibacter actiniarum TaxID=323450 RepID=A0A1X9YRD6_9BACT|nr:DEAD/DEAH box helicase [Pontibacter actiniarum]ARS35423.1 DNA helicase [Pontibacter actiniarum]
MIQEKQDFEPFKAATVHEVLPINGSLGANAEETLSSTSPEKETIIVIGKHRYYNLFTAQLVTCPRSSTGELKSPFTVLNTLDLVWSTQQPEELKFYAAISKLQGFYEASGTDTAVLKALIRNPFQYPFYLHDSNITEKISPRSISPVQVSQAATDGSIHVSQKGLLYTTSMELSIDGAYCPLSRISVQYDQFVVLDTDWYLCANPHLLQAIAYFKRHGNSVTLPRAAFLQFRKEVLAEMEDHVHVAHTYLKAATPAQLATGGFGHAPEKRLYLSESGSYVKLTPVMKYGETEIPVLSRRQIYAQDKAGKLIGVARDGEAEDAFTALLLRQHPDFEEQLETPLLYFYLHKNRFLDEDWFLCAFEVWQSQQITVLGFNDLQGNRLNQHKAVISIQVLSGVNWFNAQVHVRFGRQEASLQQLYRSVKDKSRYVQLGDGTKGILPEEWLQKLERYFRAGEVADETTLRIPKVSYAALSELFEAHMLAEEVREELNRYQVQLSDLAAIKPVSVPAGLHAELRPYQLQGLSWLSFLDSLNFGGCLADDMGLGKSIQIIAFILHLKAKSAQNAHLLLVPTSLIPNWVAEMQKFAPSLSLLILQGSGRPKSTAHFAGYDVVITTYGTLVADIAYLKEYQFSYVFLDESQNIKNPLSQRYKAARLLKARNRVAISGTPLENSTFDLYAQLSFACPGLLGTKQFFRNTYAIPIDKFKNKRSARALQDKISPFILRRTKKEVATELPEKTEVVLHCEMGSEQRTVYEAYEREFRDYIAARGEDEIQKNAMHVLRGITRLRQLCNAPQLIGEDKVASSKIAILLEQIRHISRHHKVLVFSQFVSMLDLIRKELEKEGLGYALLTGSTRDRGEVVNRFQEDEATRVFLISLKAGGTGLNLTAADYVFLVDPWWNPAVENQAIDRSYRIGQKNNVIAVRLICPDTVEEKILQLQQNKAQLASDLVGTGDDFFRSLSKAALLALATNN